MIKKQMLMVGICILSGSLLLTGCRKEYKENQENTSEETVTQTVTPAVRTEETIDNSMETDTEETVEQSETEPGEEYISEKEALKDIQDIIGDRGYYFELLDDNLEIDGKSYYVYQISDSDRPIEPKVLVDKINGELSCYYSDGSTAAFSEHPLYTGQDTDEDTTDSGKISQDNALAMLSKVPAKDLGLTEELSEYTIIFDDWTTNIKGTECYGVNAYAKEEERMVSMGLFYVATDGSTMYKFDSLLDDFVKLKAQ